MLYLFYGSFYSHVFERAYQFGLSLNSNIFIINKDKYNYANSHDMISILEYLSFFPDNDYSVSIVESADSLCQGAMQYIMSIVDNLPVNQVLILVTDNFHGIPSFLSSRSINQSVQVESNQYILFIKKFIENKDYFKIEALLNEYGLNAYNSKEALILLHAYLQPKQYSSIDQILNNYIDFIPKMYITYWQFIFLEIHS